MWLGGTRVGGRGGGDGIGDAEGRERKEAEGEVVG